MDAGARGLDDAGQESGGPMRNVSQLEVRRVAPAAQSPIGDRFDYVDSFEIRLPRPDDRPPEEWVRCGLEEAPRPLRWTILVAHRFVLRFHLAPHSAPGHVLGWRVVTSTPELVHLQASGALMVGDLVGRRDSPEQMELTTYLSFRRPLPAQFIWSAVGAVHRRVAPYLLRRAAVA
jgi:hypothetical protein